MADFRSPFVPDLPRFTGGAVGFIGYDASPMFEPVLRDAWQRADRERGTADPAEAGKGTPRTGALNHPGVP